MTAKHSSQVRAEGSSRKSCHKTSVISACLTLPHGSACTMNLPGPRAYLNANSPQQISCRKLHHNRPAAIDFQASTPIASSIAASRLPLENPGMRWPTYPWGVLYCPFGVVSSLVGISAEKQALQTSRFCSCLAVVMKWRVRTTLLPRYSQQEPTDFTQGYSEPGTRSPSAPEKRV
jgi:hypothetical protein